MKFATLSTAVTLCIALSPPRAAMVTAFVHPHQQSSQVQNNPAKKSFKFTKFKGPNDAMKLNLKNSNGNSSEENTNNEHTNAKDTSINASTSPFMSTSDDILTKKQPDSSSTSISTNTNTNINTTQPILHLESAKKVIKSATHKIRKTLDTTQHVLTNLFFHDAFGTRGEIYIFAQTFLLYSIFLGHVPLLKNLFQLVFGPLLTLLGSVICVSAIREMSDRGSFTAYSSPVGKKSGGRLVMSGLYEYVRHPVYAGNICALIGMSIITQSSMRLLLTAVYGLVVEMKARKEEEEMENVFGLEYKNYCKRVPNRFVPKLDKMRRAAEVEEKEREAARVVEHAAAKAANPRFNMMSNGNRTHDDSHRGGLFP